MAARQREFGFRLDLASGVPVYRQLVDRVRAGLATGELRRGEQLPTVRQVAVDLSINPNTVMRAYRELELLGFLDTQPGAGTFVSDAPVRRNGTERRRQLGQIASDALARCAGVGIAAHEFLAYLEQIVRDSGGKP